ncbi:hypothetical protein KC19_11G083100 [Ceratodon purpureus]|uniref:Uncharacterized protein n=1 Tax=Ceratodon purpureus TaxID=3225 RepID=A0A8T0GCV7_CERPU|nr:hypothetical protein KC19_11G083100 [Ceratodon purpureus]
MSPSSDGDPENNVAETHSQEPDVDTVQSGRVAAGQGSPRVKKSSNPVGGALSTRRQAFLRNTLCPSPGASPGTQTDAGSVLGPKKGNVGRGRVTQGVARTEKVSNMKALAQIGVQEKFRAPATVTDAGKGRGRGVKPAKRKRDGSMP